jgi:hypothetical protein
MNNLIVAHVKSSITALCCLFVFACADDTPPTPAGTQGDATVTDVSADASYSSDLLEIIEPDAVSDALDATTDAAPEPVDASDAQDGIGSDTGPPPDSVGADSVGDVPSADVPIQDASSSDTPIQDVPTDAPAEDAPGPMDTTPEDATDLGVAPLPGQLLITEFMANPDGIADGDGEWFEIVSLAPEAVDLAHCKLHDGGIDSFPLADSWATLPMEPGARWVLGPNANVETNGGVQVDVVYSDFYLSNQSDEIRITCAGEIVEEVTYDGDWPIEPGVALSFDGAASQDTVTNDAQLHWCAGQTEYVAGNVGSPGLENGDCPVLDTEVDSCVLIGPAGTEVVEGAPLVFTGLLFDEEDTDVTEGLDEVPLLVAQAGWGVAGSELDTWMWADAAGVASWNDSEMPGYDQYSVSMAAPELGSYSALFRFSMDDGATWTLCDLTGSDDGFAIEDAGSFASAEDPCIGVTCGDAPEPECFGDVFTSYSGEGTCVADGITAACVFDEATEDCALTVATCTASGCAGGATVPLVGEIVISEIMTNPSAVSDGNGEWFELVNVTEYLLNLEGCSVQGTNDTPSIITTGGALLAAPGVEMLFVRNENEEENGGLKGDYAYSGLTLGNGEDSLSLHCGDTLIDEVTWDDGLTFPDPAGSSMQLDAGSIDAAINDSGEHWCAAEEPYGDLGDLGTPGAANALCDPCLDVVCDIPPAPLCDGDQAISSEPGGVCEDGLCLYTENEPTDCALTQETCVDGACMTPCAHFCELTEAFCVGGLAVDFGEDSCEEACAQWPMGTPSDDAADTTWCRIGYLNQGDDVVPATACAAASPDGGQICVDPPTTCELYCELAPQACQNDQEIVFGESDCPTVCATWDEGDSDDMLADTAWCRLNHLELVSEDLGFHCAAATPDGGETCVDHCVDVACEPSPEASCEGTIATSYQESFCDEGECLTPQAVQDCAVTGDLCEAGACVAPPSLCSNYCDLVASTCFEIDAIDFGEAGCITTCEGWPAGDNNDVANGTTWCRINQLQSETLSSSDACSYAGLDGADVCVTTVVGLVINEFDYDQVSVDSSEFVEIYNPTASTALLGDYTLSTLNGAVGEVHAQFNLALAGAELPAGAYLVVGVQALLDTLSPDVMTLAAEVDFVQNAGNGGDAIGLFHNDGLTVDSLSYGGVIVDWTEGSVGTVEDPGPGGLSRCPDGVDSDSNDQDFLWVEGLSPGSPNLCPVDAP